MVSADAQTQCFVTIQEQLVCIDEFGKEKRSSGVFAFPILNADETLINEAASKTPHNRLTSLQRCVQAQVKDASALLSATCIQEQVRHGAWASK